MIPYSITVNRFSHSFYFYIVCMVLMYISADSKNSKSKENPKESVRTRVT